MSKRGTVIAIIAAFLAVSTAALAHVSLRLGVVRMGYQIGEKTRERRLLEEDRRRLQTELSMLKNPARIERLASEKLHMTLPDPSRIRTVRAALEPTVASNLHKAHSTRP